MTDEYLDAMRDDFEKVIAHLNKELSTIRTDAETWTARPIEETFHARMFDTSGVD